MPGLMGSTPTGPRSRHWSPTCPTKPSSKSPFRSTICSSPATVDMTARPAGPHRLLRWELALAYRDVIREVCLSDLSFPAAEFEGRLAAIRDKMKAAGLDA